MTNEVSYPKRDLRRVLQVLGAIDELKDATMVTIAERTGLDKKTVTRLIATAMSEAHVKIEKNGSTYTITDWGPIFKKTGGKRALSGALLAEDYSK